MEHQEALEVHYSDDSGLAFIFFGKKGRELPAAVVDLTHSAQLHHKTVS